MKIEIKKLNQEEFKKRNISSWPVWEKEISRFDWHYNETEECFFLEGEVIVETAKGERIEFGKGDFVVFPKGLSCTWDIKKSVRKHYNFR